MPVSKSQKMTEATHEMRHSPCGCATGAGRKALGVDPAIKASNLRRLRRIEGQVRGIQRMIEGDQYCADILVQVSAVQEALRAVGKGLMKNHLEHCAATTFKDGSTAERAAMADELLQLIYKHAR
ncbi:MAG: metal-sensitive transcriptional regulator [Bryobacterales bacterium]|nr:metal-sensitive transcriptional regulator [Bryobacterales bacterium]